MVGIFRGCAIALTSVLFFHQPAFSVPPVPTTLIEAPTLVLKASDDFRQTISVRKREIHGRRWEKLNASNGTGTVVCWNNSENYLCFGLRCGKGRGPEFVHFFSGGDFQTGRRFPIYVDGNLNSVLVIEAVDSTSELVTRYDPVEHGALLDALKDGSHMSVGYDRVVSFTLKGSSKELKRVARQCNLPVGAPAQVATNTGSKQIVAGGSVNMLFGTDIEGGDYRNAFKDPSLQGITEDACQNLCIKDRRCAAYTFNTDRKYCFLKDRVNRQKAHPSARSGIITDRRLIASPSGNSRFRKTAINTSVRHIIDHYEPAPADYNYHSAERAVDRFRTEKPPEIKTDLGVVETGPWVHHRYYDTYDIDAAMTGTVTPEPVSHLFVSAKHRDLVHQLARALANSGEQRQLAVRNIHEALVTHADSIVSAFGGEHPRLALVLLDIAYANGYLAPLNADAQNAIGDWRENIRSTYRRATDLLSRAKSQDPAIAKLIDQHMVWSGLQGWGECTVHDDSSVRSAIAAHQRINGIDAAQLGWMARLARCQTDVSKRLELSLASVGAAFELRQARPQVQMLVELGRSQFLAGHKPAARATFREAFSIHHQYVAATKPDMDFIEYGRRVDTETSAMLRDLGLDAELDLYLARVIELQIKNDYISNNAGRSWVIAFSDILEASGRADLANDYYTFLGGIETVPSPVGFMVSVADYNLDQENIGVALRILERALPIANELDKPGEKFAVLASLARAHHERGDFDNALKSGRAAMLMIKSGLNPGQENKWKFESLQSVIVSAEAEQGDRDAHALAMAQDIETKLREACRSGGNLRAFPVLPRTQLLEDPILMRSFLKTDAPSRAIDCFRKNVKRIEGVFTPGEVAMSAKVIEDVIFILALADDRKLADEMLGFLLSEAKWNYLKSNAALGAIVPAYFRKGKAIREATRKWRSYAGMSMFDVHAALLRGLAEGGKGEWLEPHFADFIKRVGPPAAEKLILSQRFVAESLPLLALDLYSIGKHDVAREFYSLLKPWLLRNRSNNRTGCETIVECEFLAFFERIYDSGQTVKSDLALLQNVYVVHNSGASVSPSEADAIAESALDEGKRHERAGRYRVAEAYFGVAGIGEIDRLLAVENPLVSIDLIRSSASLARIAHKLNDNARARRITTHFISAARKQLANRTMLGSESIIRWSHRLRDIFETHLDAAMAGPDGVIEGNDNHFLAMQYLQATRTADTVAKLEARGIAGKLVRKLQETGDRLAKLHSRLGRANRDSAAKLLREIEKLETDNAALVKRLQKEAPDYLRQTGFHFPNLRESRQQLRDDEVFLLAFTGREHTYMWMLGRGTDRFIRSAVSPGDVEKMVRDLRQGVENYLRTPEKEKDTRKWRLEPFHTPYRTLLLPFASDLDGVRRIIFVPNGAFDALPLGALLVGRPPAPEMSASEMRAAKLPWMIRDYAVNVLPSVSSVTSLSSSRERGSTHEKQFLGVGNPDFSSGLQVAALPTRTVSTQIVSIPSLPDTEQEVTAIADILGGAVGSDLLLNAGASEKNLKAADLSRYAIINFATHAVLANEIPGISEPALILAMPKELSRIDDGLLMASEIATLELDADLVMLSACNTAGSDGKPGAEGLSGLARSFFYAGARGLVVTHWEIPSKPAVDLAVGTIRAQNSQGDHDWAMALRTSVLALIDQTGRVSNVHPAAWGAHMVVGMR